MIHISKTKKGQFIVAVVSDKNGKVIMTNEPLKTRTNAIKNIIALINDVGVINGVVQDNTGKEIKMLYVYYDGSIEKATYKSVKPYQPK